MGVIRAGYGYGYGGSHRPSLAALTKATRVHYPVDTGMAFAATSPALPEMRFRSAIREACTMRPPLGTVERRYAGRFDQGTPSTSP